MKLLNFSEKFSCFLRTLQFFQAIKGKRFDEDDELRISEPTTIGFDHRKSVDDSFFSRSNSFLSRNATRRRCKTPTPNFSRDMNYQRSALEEKEFSNPFPRNMSRRCTSETHIHTASLSRNKSTQSTTPIVFSQSTAKKKPPPVERKLECALEELLDGCVKKIKITRDVITETGFVTLTRFLLPSFALCFRDKNPRFFVYFSGELDNVFYHLCGHFHSFR